MQSKRSHKLDSRIRDSKNYHQSSTLAPEPFSLGEENIRDRSPCIAAQTNTTAQVSCLRTHLNMGSDLIQDCFLCLFGICFVFRVSWQAQYFVDLEVRISWQVQDFVGVDVQVSWQMQDFVDVEVQISWQVLDS